MTDMLDKGIIEMLKRYGRIFMIFLMCSTMIAISTNTSAEGKFDVQCSFTQNPVEPDQWTTAIITVINKDDNLANLTYLGMHFDFHEYPIFFGAGIDEEEPESMASEQTKTFLISFDVPKDIQNGDYGYGIKIEYDLQDGQSGEWNSYEWYSYTQTGLQVERKDKEESDNWIPGFEVEIFLIAFLITIMGRKRK